MQQECKATKDRYNVWGNKVGWKVWVSEKRRRDLGGIWPDFGLFACLTWAPKPSWQVDTIIYSSVEGHFTDWRIRPWVRGVADSGAWGLGPVVWLCLLSVVSEQYPIKSQHGYSGSSKRERGWGGMGTKREQEEEVGKEEGRSDGLSVAWEEGRAQGYDWLQAGSKFKADAQAPALCNGGRKGDVGHREGLQTRKVGLGKRKRRKKERKENPLKGFCNEMSRFVW